MATAGNSCDSHIETDGADIRVSKDDEYKKYIHLMPSDLKEQNFDGLVLYSQRDCKEAQEFAKHLSRDITFRIDPNDMHLMHPIIEILDDFRGNGCHSLDNLLNRTTYVFLFLTKSFCAEKWSHLITNGLISNKASFIPVDTENSEGKSLKSLGTLVNGIKPIKSYKKDRFYIQSVSNLFHNKGSERIDRDRYLNCQRKKYFNENRIELMEMAKIHYSQNKTRKSSPKSGIIETDSHLNSGQCPQHTYFHSVNSALHSCDASYATNDSQYSSYSNMYSSNDSNSLDSLDAQEGSSSGNSNTQGSEYSNVVFRNADIRNACESGYRSKESVSSSKRQDPATIQHVYIIKSAANVIIGDNARMIVNHKSASDSEEEFSDEITRPPHVNDSERISPNHMHNDSPTGSAIAREGLTDLQHRCSMTSSENTSDNPPVSFLQHQDETRVKSGMPLFR